MAKAGRYEAAGGLNPQISEEPSFTRGEITVTFMVNSYLASIHRVNFG